MARLGKRLLSAFIETTEDKKEESPDKGMGALSGGAAGAMSAAGSAGAGAAGGNAVDQRFADYFDKLFGEANIPGPDYYEFSKMVRAMQLISDEQSRYHAAFAGLQVQGLDKQKLLSTAAEYLRVLTADANQFQTTVEAALQEKVKSRMAEAEEKGRRIQALSQEILKLQEEIGAMQREIGENKDKLTASSTAYVAESSRRKQEIEADIQKINHYIH
ncbi:MAG TPA: hypothetical protein VK518_00530 [Puia sp.]|nr:hypothetical protein [Puia sp.]